MIRRFRVVVMIALAAAILADCGGPRPPIGTPRAVAQVPANTGYKSLYSFGTGSDGRAPKAALIDVNGTLYGTTYAGGADGLGTIFSMSTTGIEKVLYSFQGGNDGANPSASLLAVKEILYGTTEYGGETKFANGGTVFKSSTDGREKVLHKFGPIPDGSHPVASLINVRGKLYGTTYSGGANEYYGTVFRINASGKEEVLHSFNGYGDGAGPLADLIDVKGILYGTTEYGEEDSGLESGGFGTVFSVSTTGTETVLYNFPYGGADGYYPAAGLINVNDTLYGTTASGGAYHYGPSGTVFSITTSGSLTNLHSFGSGGDEGHPVAPLLNVKGTLYGTSSGGPYGKGTVFSMSLTGTDEKGLHGFGHGSDGAMPLAGLINVNGTLYGTTSAGGKYGEGTVFSLTP